MASELACGHWSDLVRKIAEGDASGIEQLYGHLRDLTRGKFLANVPRTAVGYCFEDSLHEVLLIVLDAISRRQLRDPARLPAFVRTVARRQFVAHIRGAAAGRRHMAAAVDAWSTDTPEARLSGLERSRRVRDALAHLCHRDREILERFYYKEQPAEQICGEMHLTGTQFRLYKSRAIAKCSLVMRNAVSRPVPVELRIA